MMDAAYRVEPLDSHHDRAAFSCGIEALDEYLYRQAGQDVRRRVAAVFVLTELISSAIMGYYSLSATSIQGSGLPPDTARRLPRYPHLPAILLGRFAVELRRQGQRVGAILLADALQRSLQVASQAGAMFVIVDAKNDPARSFYERHGFRRFVDDEYRLFLPMTAITQAAAHHES